MWEVEDITYFGKKKERIKWFVFRRKSENKQDVKGNPQQLFLEQRSPAPWARDQYCGLLGTGPHSRRWAVG